MATPVSELDLPFLGFGDDRNERLAATLTAAEESWLARGEVGYSILLYDDVVAILRDKRWHSAVPLVIEMSAEATPEFKMRRRESILSA